MCQPIEPPRPHDSPRDDSTGHGGGDDAWRGGEYRQRVSARFLAQLPSTEQVVQVLQDVVQGGLPGYREAIEDPALTLPDEVDPALREQMLRWEERSSHRAHLWAEDRFKLGFAIGSGQFARLLTAFDW